MTSDSGPGLGPDTGPGGGPQAGPAAQPGSSDRGTDDGVTEAVVQPLPVEAAPPTERGRTYPVPLTPDEYSARTTATRAQVVAIVSGGVLLLAALVLWPVTTLVMGVALATVVYFIVNFYRIRLFDTALRRPQIVTISDDEAREIPDSELPPYTVLVPAYGEPEVIKDLVASLQSLEYSAEQLDVVLLLEEDDEPTIAAATSVIRDDYITIFRIPASDPRTKPKALNYGLTVARGGYLTIYDAEDRPDPLQLRRAVAAFRRVDHSVACLQAKLVYHNARQNIITRWFAVEYIMWFSHFLPGLVGENSPVPLGGTSNHFRTPILKLIGGWDAYNVTEDADLGVRLHRLGYRTGVLDSITYEEANSDFVNWVRQRSRWYKGYMQTWLVHTRHPIRLWRAIGARGFLGFNLFVGGTPLLALVNPVFWTLTLMWFTVQPGFVARLFPPWVYYAGLLTFAIGNFSVIYTNVVSARESREPMLVLAALTTPLYWLMMSIAATKALVQLIFAPSFWEKTAHGLGGSSDSDPDVSG